MAINSSPPEPTRTLGLPAAVSMVIGTVIGSGIFLVTAPMMRAVGSPFMVLAVWIFGDGAHIRQGMFRKICGDRLPGLAEVRRLVDVRIAIVHQVKINAHIRRTRVKRG